MRGLFGIRFEIISRHFDIESFLEQSEIPGLIDDLTGNRVRTIAWDLPDRCTVVRMEVRSIVDTTRPGTIARDLCLEIWPVSCRSVRRFIRCPVNTHGRAPSCSSATDDVVERLYYLRPNEKKS
jgi:hypothetical protein